VCGQYQSQWAILVRVLGLGVRDYGLGVREVLGFFKALCAISPAGIGVQVLMGRRGYYLSLRLRSVLSVLC
jgi:hypothetical protein